VLETEQVKGLLSSEHFSDPGLGIDQELPAQGRTGRASLGGTQQ
jgi:hypothetical protein